MRKQARNNQKIVRPTPTVRKTIPFLTRSIVALTITDISYCDALVCSTERTRRRSRNVRNVLRNQYVAIQKLFIFRSGYSLATVSLVTQFCLLQNTATNT